MKNTRTTTMKPPSVLAGRLRQAIQSDPRRLTTVNAIFVLGFPIVGVVGAVVTILLGLVTPLHLLLFGVGFVLSGLGITVGYHRLATHRSFETSAPVKALLLILGSTAMEGPVVDWVAVHVKHHAFSDRDGDPHSPNQGIVHAHWGWMFNGSMPEIERYAATVLRDPVAMFVSNTFLLWVVLGFVVPFLIAGWEGFIWGGLLRQLAVQNVTFAVNSVCHRWGTRPFKTTDVSRNNWVVGILGLGEGWHNNHHAFPTSAYHGLRWWEFDLSRYVIRGLELAGLVRNVRRPTAEQLRVKLFAPNPLASSSAG